MNKIFHKKLLYAPMYIRALFITAKTWKKSECPLTDEYIRKNVVYKYLEHYLALKRKEIVTYATRWTSLEDIMLSEITLSER